MLSCVSGFLVFLRLTPMLLWAHDEFCLSVCLLLHELFIPLVIVDASASSGDARAFVYLFQHP